ncbi:bilirubin oxidase [Helicobacter didelphidarum]|uniref:Bilirubin oxidase n=1 Tax=Helicobacter didelphidarum TaxID=2040648 RepID=A0A3D8IQJ6_9HELI|nr:multicopper oxidase family protein [Helicobacter didelphidarum]RDU67567.1 bilirubin oxidase [Helicobacter didelphidarum]
MNRRQFFTFNAVMLASANFASSAESKHHNHANMNHNIMSHTSNHNMPKPNVVSNNIQLLDRKLFPSNNTLPKLTLLKNESEKKGFFRGTIVIKESKIEIVKGKPTTFYTYNGLIPGPKIEAYEGDTIEILVQNHLNEPTTIHWHGMPVPPNQDGNPHDPILPHQERIYRFSLPNGSAGTYWYHPHPHYITAKQVYMGLAGTFIVRAKDDKLAHLQEQDLVVSDLRLDINAQIPGNNIYDWLNGREGEFVLVNGALTPKISITGTQRLRIYNVCAARYLQLYLPQCKFIIVGTDGGAIESPQNVGDTLFLAPAQRVEVIIEAPNGKYTLQNLYYDRDKMMVKDNKSPLSIANITSEDQDTNVFKSLPQILRKLPALSTPKASKKVIFSEMEMDHSSHDMKHMESMLPFMFHINGKTFDMNRAEFESKVGEVEEWEIINNSHMDHPFHIHGTQFELISSTHNNKIIKPKFRSLQDTINLRPKEILRLRMRQDFKGLRMFHCHILEHEDLGMMSMVKVV